MNKQTVSMVCAAVALVAGCATTGKPVNGPAASAVPVLKHDPLRPEYAREGQLMYELLVGELAGKRGEIDVATEHYLRASKLSNDPRIAARTARIAAFSKDFDVALKAAKRWVRLEPDSIEANQVVGLLLVQGNQPEAAAKHLAKVVELAGKDKYELSFARLSLLMARHVVTDAELKTMRLLAERFPKVSHAQRSYAEVLYRAKQYDQALKVLDKALALDPRDDSSRILRNRTLLALGRVDEALDGMRKMVAESPDDPELVHSLARMLVQANRYQEAHQQYLRALELQPGDFDLLYSLALLEVELKRYDEAVANLKKLAKSPTHAADAFYYLGRVAEERQQWDMAMSWYLQIPSGERYFEAQTRVANLLAKLGRRDEALEHIARLRKSVSDETLLAHLDLAEGDVYRSAGDYEGAYKFFTEALKRHPNNIDLLYARAMTGEKLGHIDWLERDLKTILKLEPDNGTALNALGYTLADHGKDLQQAYQYIKRALEIRPDDAAVLDSMGWVNFRLGNYKEAEKYLTKALSMLEDAEIASHLAEVQWELGKRAKAVETVRKALKVYPHDDRLLKLQKRISN